MQETKTEFVLENKVVERLQIFRAAKKLGDVSEACRLGGITRTQFYRYKKRYKEFGLEGLEDRPPVPRFSETKEEQREEFRESVIQLALGYPSEGCTNLEKRYPIQWSDTFPNVSPSFVTIRRILLDEGLGTQRERWLHLEAGSQSGEIEIGDHQRPFMARFNPAWREADFPAQQPGDHLCQMVVARRELSRGSAIFAHIGVDTFDLRAWVMVRDRRQKGDTETLLKQQIVPFYNQHGLRIKVMQTHRDRDFGHDERFRAEEENPLDTDFTHDAFAVREKKPQPHSYRSYLRDRNIVHQPSKLSLNEFNGVAQLFYLTFRDEFLLPRLQSEPHVAIEELQSDLETWLKFYNEERPHPGYPNFGKPPAQRFAEFLAQKKTKPRDAPHPT